MVLQNQRRLLMERTKVRCWEIDVNGRDRVFITYPEDNYGHDLISCLNCGAIYAASVFKQVYHGPPLSEKLKEINCWKCNELLANTYNLYPDKFLSISGEIKSFDRLLQIPLDEDSLVEEFYSIY